ncbi:MAG: hypothetical protein IPG53_23085 [Ignavibacteriales bacterium]|nr:hypothetical protein [Ignavibacteriales bacterium]
MHKERTNLWGYAADEQLSNDDLISENYTGIRPAPGHRRVSRSFCKDNSF